MLGTILIFSKRTGMRAVLPVVAAAVLAACSAGPDSAADTTTTTTASSSTTTTITQPQGGDEPSLTVVATTSIAGDLVRQIVGDSAAVDVLMPIGTDPHDFQPSSQQAATLRRADLVVSWGLGLEEGLLDVLASAASDGVRVLEISALVDPIEFGAHDYHDDHAHDDDHDHAHDDDHDHAHDDEEHSDHEHDLDPHTWMDPVRMAAAARAIGQALDDIDPAGGWIEEGERVAEELLAVHEEVSAILSVVSEDRRRLVTNHDSLGYLADRYGFEVVGVAIPGGSTLAAPSSAQIASLVAAIREAGVTVLFAETTSPATLLAAIAGEVEGARVVEILTGSLAQPGQPGDTLAGMLVHNAEVIADALGSG